MARYLRQGEDLYEDWMDFEHGWRLGISHSAFGPKCTVLPKRRKELLKSTSYGCGHASDTARPLYKTPRILN